MSTVYVAEGPLTIEQIIDRTDWWPLTYLGEPGQVIEPSLLFTDGTNFIHADEDGTMFERFGANDVEEFVNLLDLVSDEDDRYWERLGYCPLCGEEDDGLGTHVCTSTEEA